MAIYHTYVRLVPSWKQGRSRDQNTNARKLSERKGSGGTVQIEMKTRELATKKHGPSRKIERRSTARVARQVWVQRAAHSKRVARKKPIPENRKVKGGGHARDPAIRTKKTHPNTYVIISSIRPYATKEAGGVPWCVLCRRKYRWT